MKLGERIELMIEERGLNKHKLAEISGVPYTTIYTIIEKSKKQDSYKVSYDVLRKLALALGVSDVELQYGSIDAFKKAMACNEFTNAIINEQTKDMGQLSQIESDLFDAFEELNMQGQLKAVERVKELAEIPKYRKEAE